MDHRMNLYRSIGKTCVCRIDVSINQNTTFQDFCQACQSKITLPDRKIHLIRLYSKQTN